MTHGDFLAVLFAMSLILWLLALTMYVRYQPIFVAKMYRKLRATNQLNEAEQIGAERFINLAFAAKKVANRFEPRRMEPVYQRSEPITVEVIDVPKRLPEARKELR